MGNYWSTNTSKNNMAEVNALNNALARSNAQLAAQLQNSNSRDLVHQAMKVQNVGMPTGIYSRPGYSGTDPLNQYSHVCDSCGTVPARPSIMDTNLKPMQLDPSAPRPYDAHDALSHHLNVCFDPANSVKTQCQLR